MDQKKELKQKYHQSFLTHLLSWLIHPDEISIALKQLKSKKGHNIDCKNMISFVWRSESTWNGSNYSSSNDISKPSICFSIDKVLFLDASFQLRLYSEGLDNGNVLQIQMWFGALLSKGRYIQSEFDCDMLYQHARDNHLVLGAEDDTPPELMASFIVRGLTYCHLEKLLVVDNDISEDVINVRLRSPSKTIGPISSIASLIQTSLEETELVGQKTMRLLKNLDQCGRRKLISQKEQMKGLGLLLNFKKSMSVMKIDEKRQVLAGEHYQVATVSSKGEQGQNDLNTNGKRKVGDYVYSDLGIECKPFEEGKAIVQKGSGPRKIGRRRGKVRIGKMT